MKIVMLKFGVNDTGDKFMTGVVNTGYKIRIGVSDTNDEFMTGVVDAVESL